MLTWEEVAAIVTGILDAVNVAGMTRATP